MLQKPVECIVSVNALIIFNDEILLQRIVKKNNRLGLVGGKVEEEETFEEALFREVYEETGISEDMYSYEKVAILHDKPQVACKHIYILYMKSKFQEFIFNPQEISECFWIKLSEVPMDMELYRNSWVLSVIQDYMEGAFSNRNKLYTLL